MNAQQLADRVKELEAALREIADDSTSPNWTAEQEVERDREIARRALGDANTR